jgi:hypothetical protein
MVTFQFITCIKAFHMRWFRSATLSNTLSPFFSATRRRDSRETTEPIRQAMLAALGEDGARHNPQLYSRLSALHDPLALWYARGDVVAVLSQLHGEAKAVATVQELLPFFKGVLPRSMTDSCRTPR